ncbi:MAG TPA: PilZ domain-containing protein [Macromonas sp.]|nr:PilZ domain-containing protein [Macromonas sp.]
MTTSDLVPAERRQFWRAVFHAPVHVAAAGRVHKTQLLDLSLKGALIEAGPDWPLAVGDPCHVRLDLVPGISISMDATVAHLRGNQVGLRCDHIDIDSITHLRRLVELNAGSAAWLEREIALLVQAH